MVKDTVCPLPSASLVLLPFASFLTSLIPQPVHLNITPRSAKNLRQAASTDSRVLVETGLSGISNLWVFWRIRMASVEFIDRSHR